MEKWQDPQVLFSWFIFIVSFFLLLVSGVTVFFYVAMKKNIAAKEKEAELRLKSKNRMIKAHLEAQEEERVRIASDLHDDIISKLTIVRYKQAMLCPNPELDNMLGDTITELRKITHELHPPYYESKSLDEILNSLMVNWKLQHEVEYNLINNTAVEISNGKKIQIVRIIQELYQNTLKHAAATKVILDLSITNKYIYFRFQDLGKGMDFSKTRNGIGIQNIELRCHQIEGKSKFKSLPNKGTSFICQTPL